MSYSLAGPSVELRIAGQVVEGTVERSDRVVGISFIAAPTGEIAPITWADRVPELGDGRIRGWATRAPGCGSRRVACRQSRSPCAAVPAIYSRASNTPRRFLADRLEARSSTPTVPSSA